ncbi:hypothetical protein LTR37_013394 [Vermiconidia calcicola]|uniref:Uncharacterized protein n=1 Tax=Vermiconidia calcicola TaxID=1690605 RepID=A0ACC3MWR6_9PEZI|nr:hypothetical protein LTR37_013394 [Vermiconidia calcicola]
MSVPEIKPWLTMASALARFDFPTTFFQPQLSSEVLTVEGVRKWCKEGTIAGILSQFRREAVSRGSRRMSLMKGFGFQFANWAIAADTLVQRAMSVDAAVPTKVDREATQEERVISVMHKLVAAEKMPVAAPYSVAPKDVENRLRLAICVMITAVKDLQVDNSYFSKLLNGRSTHPFSHDSGEDSEEEKKSRKRARGDRAGGKKTKKSDIEDHPTVDGTVTRDYATEMVPARRRPPPSSSSARAENESARKDYQPANKDSILTEVDGKRITRLDEFEKLTDYQPPVFEPHECAPDSQSVIWHFQNQYLSIRELVKAANDEADTVRARCSELEQAVLLADQERDEAIAEKMEMCELTEKYHAELKSMEETWEKTND